MRPSPLLSAAAAVAVLGAVAGPATAASTPAPAQGVASTSVTLLGVTAGGQTVTAGTLELLSDMLGAESVAKILLTPLTANGTAYGQQTVTPGSSPASAPAVSTSAVAPALNGIVGLSSPVLTASATNNGGEPATSAGAASLGSLDVLGLPVALDGTLDVGSLVTKAGGAAGQKTVVVKDVALPSVADLLAALGLDLKALPIEVLNELLKELDLVNTAVTTANKALTEAMKEIQAAVDAAQAAVDKAAADLDAAQKSLIGKSSELAAAEKDLAAKTAALQPARDALSSAQAQLSSRNAELTKTTADLDKALSDAGLAGLEAYNALPALLKEPLAPVIDPLVAAQTAGQNAVTAASAAVAQATADLAAAQSLVDAAAAVVSTLKAAIAALQATIDDLQKVLDAAVAALQTLLRTVQPQIDALLGAITAVLDGTPLVSFDSLSVVTEATASSNTPGGQSAKVVGGEIAGLTVLGTDVLNDVLRTGKIDLLDLTATQLAAVNGLIGQLTGTLSEVLSTVPQFPTLSIPAPQVGLLTKSTSTGVEDGFGVASTSVKGLSITLPSVSIPSALALPGAADLPALDGVTQTVTGLLSSAPIRLDVATLASNARFAPAVGGRTGLGTPGTQTPDSAAPQLPRTGASQALAVLAVLLVAGAVVARRRTPADAGSVA